jgi:tyrosine-protein kinase Etk/Wzc
MHKKSLLKRFSKLITQNIRTLLFFVIAFTVASFFYAYMTKDLYRASSSMHIGNNKHTAASQDILDSVINSTLSDVNTEIEVMKSRTLIAKAIETIEFKKRYYVNTLLGREELYEKSPFEVDLIYGEGLIFEITPVKEKHFLLEVSGRSDNGSERWEESKLCSYGQVVKTAHFMFTLSLKEKQQPEQNRTYSFQVLSTNAAITEAQNALFVTRPYEDTSIVNIHYLDPMPQRAKAFNTALLDTYLKYDIKIQTEKLSRTLAFIDEQLSGLSSNMEDSKKYLKTIESDHSALAFTLGGQQLSQKLKAYQEEKRELSGRKETVKKIKKMLKEEGTPTLVGLNINTGVSEQVKQLQELVDKKVALRVDFTPLHPAVKAVSKNIEAAKKRLDKSLENMEFEIEKRSKTLDREIKETEEEMKELPEREKLFGDLKQRFVANKEIHSYFLEKRATTAILKASTIHHSSVIDYAMLPCTPVSPNRMMIILSGILYGLLGGILFTVMRNMIDNRIKSEEDIVENCSLALLGNIPYIKDQQHDIFVFNAPKSVISEAFRALRTNLQFFSKEQEEGRVISITSTIGGEGKTTVSSNLAGVLALSGKKTILINMDLRKPTLHLKFSLPNGKGMSTLLSNNHTLDEVIQQTKYKNIDMITSGPIPPNPSELIENEQMDATLARLITMYDIIILDTPPIGLVTDAMYLMKMSDITLYVLRQNYSKKVFLDEIYQMSKEHHIKGLGLILNGSKTYKHGYGYYEEGK